MSFAKSASSCIPLRGHLAKLLPCRDLVTTFSCPGARLCGPPARNLGLYLPTQPCCRPPVLRSGTTRWGRGAEWEKRLLLPRFRRNRVWSSRPVCLLRAAFQSPRFLCAFCIRRERRCAVCLLHLAWDQKRVFVNRTLGEGFWDHQTLSVSHFGPLGWTANPCGG